MGSLSKRWTPLRPHPVQRALYKSDSRFCVIAAGRRSGKTELAKRKCVEEAMAWTLTPDGRFIAAAPTRPQAASIWWDDLKKLMPKWILAEPPIESEMELRLKNGVSIIVVGLDRPQRIEGNPIDFLFVTEFDDVKPHSWSHHLRPALSTDGRPGRAWLEGVPEGRRMLWKMRQRALSMPGEPGGPAPEWSYFHWLSADILSPEEIESAKRDLDELTYKQEYEADFLHFSGRAYYCFDVQTHASRRLQYDPSLPLCFCFDFNVSPGIAVVLQEQANNGRYAGVGKMFTAVIGEVFIISHSNTQMVTRRLAAEWSHHKGSVFCYGDATGGARGTQAIEGSDWEIVKRELERVFEGRVNMRVPKGNPEERVRVNSLNSRLKTTDGMVHLLVDPVMAPHVVTDLDSVSVVEGGSGEIDKKTDHMLTHPSDAVGYHVYYEHPIDGGPMTRTEEI